MPMGKFPPRRRLADEEPKVNTFLHPQEPTIDPVSAEQINLQFGIRDAPESRRISFPKDSTLLAAGSVGVLLAGGGAVAIARLLKSRGKKRASKAPNAIQHEEEAQGQPIDQLQVEQRPLEQPLVQEQQQEQHQQHEQQQNEELQNEQQQEVVAEITAPEEPSKPTIEEDARIDDIAPDELPLHILAPADSGVDSDAGSSIDTVAADIAAVEAFEAVEAVADIADVMRPGGVAWELRSGSSMPASKQEEAREAVATASARRRQEQVAAADAARQERYKQLRGRSAVAMPGRDWAARNKAAAGRRAAAAMSKAITKARAQAARETRSAQSADSPASARAAARSLDGSERRYPHSRASSIAGSDVAVMAARTDSAKAASQLAGRQNIDISAKATADSASDAPPRTAVAQPDTPNAAAAAQQQQQQQQQQAPTVAAAAAIADAGATLAAAAVKLARHVEEDAAASDVGSKVARQQSLDQEVLLPRSPPDVTAAAAAKKVAAAALATGTSPKAKVPFLQQLASPRSGSISGLAAPLVSPRERAASDMLAAVHALRAELDAMKEENTQLRAVASKVAELEGEVATLKHGSRNSTPTNGAELEKFKMNLSIPPRAPPSFTSESSYGRRDGGRNSLTMNSVLRWVTGSQRRSDAGSAPGTPDASSTLLSSPSAPPPGPHGGDAVEDLFSQFGQPKVKTLRRASTGEKPRSFI